MPPKKKRIPQDVTAVVDTTVSTTKRTSQRIKPGTANIDNLSTKQPIKKLPKLKISPKIRKPLKKRKSRIKINKNNETLEESVEYCNENNVETGELGEELIEEIEEEMDSTDVKDSETIACEISEQLENLDVNTEEVKESNTVVRYETFEEFALECVAEEIPVDISSEVVIEEEITTTTQSEESDIVLNTFNSPQTPKNESEDTSTSTNTELANNDFVDEKTSESNPELAHDNDETTKEIESLTEQLNDQTIEPEETQKSIEENDKTLEPPKKAVSFGEAVEIIIPKPEEKKATKRAPRKPKEPKVPRKAQPKKPPKPKQPKKEGTKKESPTKKGNTIKIDVEGLVRRSSRIKSISVLKQRSKGHGLVKSKSESIDLDSVDNNSNPSHSETEKLAQSTEFTANPSNDYDNKPVKVKSRWRRSSEMEMNVLQSSVQPPPNPDAMHDVKPPENNNFIPPLPVDKTRNQDHSEEVAKRLKQFVHLKDNQYLTERFTCKEAKKMICDCFLTNEEIERGEFGCGEDCLNRLLMIECGPLCPVGERCTNKKFQKNQFAPVEVFKTEKKGLGLRAAANIPYGEFILEYVGEVLDHEEFDKRVDSYSNDKNTHYYFMSLRADAIIDATKKGNISRFINHSCDPNAETQKWTVNGELRIGFFSTRTILAGEEVTFDYRFERYGKEAQKCYCESAICRGWLGEEPDDEDEDEDEEDEDEGDEKQQENKDVQNEKIDDLHAGDKVKEKKERAKPKERKPRRPRKKPKDIFEDLDQLDEEIEMLVTTGLKNQAHTLKLSRLMVRAKEPAQRTKLLRILRRGELPCRRLFLDYHGLRLMHGYMTDAEDLAKTDAKFHSLRLELLQTLATLPIPNKTMLEDSKVLPTVEKWSKNVPSNSPLNSNSSSPKSEQFIEPEIKKEEPPENTPMEVEATNEEKAPVEVFDCEEIREISEFINSTAKPEKIKQEDDETTPKADEEKPKDLPPEKESEPQPNYEEEIIALALKLLEEWSILKEVFKIPKKERIEQMKEHEREANRIYIAGLGLEQDAEKKNESRYRGLKKVVRWSEKDNLSMANRKGTKLDDRVLSHYPKLGKYERRKMFAIQVEHQEEERRRKQREMWRQHEQHCILLGTDPRLTAPYDPNRGYQCIWNPQIGQWQNYPLTPQNQNVIYNPPPASHPYGYSMTPGVPLSLPSLPYQEEAKKIEEYSQVKFMGPIPLPVKLPPKWKCAKDKYGRPYYYHLKLRKSQWEPPSLTGNPAEIDDSSETTSSSDTSSLSSDTSSEESDSDDDLNDTKLLLNAKKQIEKPLKVLKALPAHLTTEETDTPSSVEEEKVPVKETEEHENNVEEEKKEEIKTEIETEKPPSPTPVKKRRTGLVQEIIISPRTEEDRLKSREEAKRYKQNKLKRRKEILMQLTKQFKEKRHKSVVKSKMKEMLESNTESAKRIKETFRSNMATFVVSVLNAYRKADCKEGRITNTDDFKHLARKLTHFVMLKEMKHILKIEDLECTENVKGKAREYIRKYMSKFGETYQKRQDEPDY